MFGTKPLTVAIDLHCWVNYLQSVINYWLQTTQQKIYFHYNYTFFVLLLDYFRPNFDYVIQIKYNQFVNDDSNFIFWTAVPLRQYNLLTLSLTASL